MLFEVDQSVAELFVSGSPTARDFLCLRNLAMGVAEGSHRLGGHRRTLQALAGLDLGESRLSFAFERAAGRVAVEGQLLRSLKVVAKVVVSSVATPESQTSSGQRRITLPLGWFDSSTKVQPTSLVGENLDDVAVAGLIARVGSVLSSYRYLQLSRIKVHGGGSSIKAVVQDQIDEDRICICLADSDKKSPGSDFGQTAKGLLAFDDESQFPLVKVLVTAGRDIENTLPDSFYLEEYGSHGTYSTLTDFLMKLSERGEHEIRSFIDIEKGLALHDVWELPPGSLERAFWESKLALILQIANKEIAQFQCGTSRVCVGSRSVCGCIVVAGNPSNILRDFARRYTELHAHRLAESVGPTSEAEWREMGCWLIAWCCGDSRIRV